MVVSDGLRSTFIWSKSQNFPGGACPQVPLYGTTLRALRPHTTVCCAHRTNSQFMYAPPSSISGSAPSLEQEEDNNHDKFAVSLLKDATVIGHVPQESSLV